MKHSSKLTLLLSGQREGATIPHYCNGDTIEGILAIARPAGVLALDVKVRPRLTRTSSKAVLSLKHRSRGKFTLRR